MNDQQRELIKRALAKHDEWAKTCTKEEALAYLVSLGIYDKDGNLTPEYGGEKP